jgi:hypothetical protein
VTAPPEIPTPAGFSNFWDFALALNRGDAAALALARNGCEPEIAVHGAELRKLLVTVWFRAVFERLSESWRAWLFEAVTELVPLTNHVVRIGRHHVPLSDVSVAQLSEFATRTDLPDAVRSDVQVLTAIGRFWGEDALRECQFTGDNAIEPARFDVLGIRSLLPR